jgi:hypothetical protein
LALSFPVFPRKLIDPINIGFGREKGTDVKKGNSRRPPIPQLLSASQYLPSMNLPS